MKLPKWNRLKTNYPVVEAGRVFKRIGGKVELNYRIGVFRNACATRVSKALNGAGVGHQIPYIKELGASGKLESQVSSGKYNKWYIFRVKVLVKYLKSKYGNPEQLKYLNYKKLLQGRKGIIVFKVSGWSDATGHADLWDGKRCLWKDYGGQANKILFWESQ